MRWAALNAKSMGAEEETMKKGILSQLGPQPNTYLHTSAIPPCQLSFAVCWVGIASYQLPGRQDALFRVNRLGEFKAKPVVNIPLLLGQYPKKNVCGCLSFPLYIHFTVIKSFCSDLFQLITL